MTSPIVWLITGASSGFGNALTEVLLRKGEIVAATLRTPSVLAHLTSRYPPSQLLVLSLDVTRPDDITTAFARTRDVFGRLDVVFNNAGYSIFGEVEAMSDADARALFEVNFWGAVSVSRAAVRFFREVNPPGKGGVILQNSSISGFLGPPGAAFYCSSKHAIEGFTESLSRELPAAWNIKICILQPGGFDTKMANTKVLPAHPAYTNCTTAQNTLNNTSFDGDPGKFAETLYRMVNFVDASGDRKKLPLYLPIEEDALAALQGRLKRVHKWMVDAKPWSEDLKKDKTKL